MGYPSYSSHDPKAELSHYVARLVVERVERVTRSTGSHTEPILDREVTEIASFTVKENSVEKMRGKLNAHISIIDDYQYQEEDG